MLRCFMNWLVWFSLLLLKIRDFGFWNLYNIVGWGDGIGEG